MTMRECWVNVYRSKYGEHGYRVGQVWHSKASADRPIKHSNGSAIFRLHIRLKPEGAPRRYSSERNRQQWETMPEEMRKCPF